MKQILWALPLALTAGALGPAPRAQTLAQTQDRPPADVWQALGDPVLQQLVDEAVRSNPDVWSARARLRGARAARVDAALDFAPTVTASASYTRQRLASAAFPGASGVFPEQHVWDTGLLLAWELDVFGRVRRTSQARGALAAAAEEDVRDVQVLLAAELAGAYFDLRGAQARLAVAESNARNQRRTLDVTLQRLEAGRGNEFDSERARAQLSSTLAGIPALEAAIAAAQHRVGVLVGRPPAALARELAAGAPLPTLPETLTVSSPDSAVRLRPDVRSAERQVAASAAFVGAAQAAYLPQVTLGGAFGYASNSFEALGNVGRPRYAIGPVVSWPALNLGRVKVGVDAARAREAEATARHHQTQLRALEEIETSLVTYHKARASLEHLEAAAAASERAAALARLRFEEGATDFLQVLDAERTTLEAQDRLAVGRTAATTGLVAVYRALGGTGALEARARGQR